MKAGLLGTPIAHSLSPVMHNAAYAALGLDWEYARYPDSSEAACASRIQATRSTPAFIGYNVTMPYKKLAASLCDHLSPAAQISAAANVLTFLHGDPPTVTLRERSGREVIVWGSNTDGAGIVGSLRHDAGVDPSRSHFVLCGTGPTAAAAFLALLDAQAASVTVMSRDSARAQQFIDTLLAAWQAVVMPIGQNSPPTTLVTAVASTQAAAALAQAEVLIDATPLGMKPGDPAVIPVELLTSCHTVLDVVYGHGLTPLLAGAQLAGAQALDGLGMLVEQAALTIEIWAAARGLILTAPRALMREAALQELQSRS